MSGKLANVSSSVIACRRAWAISSSFCRVTLPVAACSSCSATWYFILTCNSAALAAASILIALVEVLDDVVRLEDPRDFEPFDVPDLASSFSSLILLLMSLRSCLVSASSSSIETSREAISCKISASLATCSQSFRKESL